MKLCAKLIPQMCVWVYLSVRVCICVCVCVVALCVVTWRWLEIEATIKLIAQWLHFTFSPRLTPNEISKYSNPQKEAAKSFRSDSGTAHQLTQWELPKKPN